MKKAFLTVLCTLILSSGVAFAKTVNNSELTTAIRLYKAHNYTECYNKLQTSIKKDPSNPLAYYYLGMVYAQVGNRPEAIANYEKAISLAPEGSNLNRFAQKGKICLENPEKCNEEVNAEDAFIRGAFGKGFSEKARSEYERLKIENMMRQMNRTDDIAPQNFREFRDFSGMNNDAAPTNDEIVAALRTLQKAGLLGNNGATLSDISLLTGNSYNNYNNQNMLMNLMGNGNLNPQLIQAMMGNMTLGF